MLKKIQNNKNILLLIILFCSVFGLFFNIIPVLASDEGPSKIMVGIVTIVGWIAFLISYVIGYIATVAIDVLIWVAQFNNIIGVDAVVKGWVVVRDLCNMFFILILLVIAFATILRLPNYEWKKLLPKLLIMAVLINFSRTICGLIIDFSQVIMLTFVNGFATTGTGHFVEMFKMKEYGSLTGVNDEALKGGSAMAVAAGIIMGVFAMLVSVIVILVMLAVLVMRIIMLWVYTILSPIAFLAAAFPAGQKYSSQWWGEFSKNVIVGPVLAFFIWLALLTAGTSSDDLSKSAGGLKDITGGSTISASTGKTQVTSPNALFSTGNFQSYIITLALLIGGLMVTQQMGGIASSIAGKGMDWAKRAPKLIGGGSLKVGSWGARKFAASKHGFEIRPSKVIAGFRETLAEKKRKEDIRIEEKSASMLKEGKLIRGGLGASRDFSEAAAKGFLWNRAWKVSGDPKKMGIMQSTWKAGGVRKNIEKLEKERDEKATTEKRKSEINNEIATQREEMAKYETPQTFYAHQKSMTAYQEAAKKSGMKDNEDEIVETFDKAIENGDNELAVGMILHAVEVGHGNEILQKHRALEDVYDDNGNVVTKKGEFFRQDNSGMRGFFKQYVQGKMGLSEQEALSIQSQFSSRAKAVTHMNLSESVGKKNGLFYQRSDEEQQSRAHGETMKMDVETMLRKLNRIGQGSEIQYEDEDDNKKIKRRFVANGLTTKNFLKTAPTLDLEVNDRKRLNPNFAENTFVNYMMYEGNGGKFKEKSLVEIMDKLGTSYTTKEGDTISHKQLALETAAFGGEKYIANLLMKKIDAETSNASPAELKKIGEEIKNAEGVLSGVREKLRGDGMFIRKSTKKEGDKEPKK